MSTTSYITAIPMTPTTSLVNITLTKLTKTAPIDTVIFDEDSVPVETMTDLIFENIGGHELINIARNDTVNGQKISYSPIKNLIRTNQEFNANNVLSIQSTSDKYFSNFSIKFENKVPFIGNGPSGANIYVDQTTGNLIIETINNDLDDQIEVQIGIGGTIYEADIGES